MPGLDRRAFLKSIAATGVVPLINGCGGGGTGAGGAPDSATASCTNVTGIPDAVPPVLPPTNFSLPKLVSANQPRLRGAHLNEYATWTDPNYSGWVHLPEFPYWGGNVIRLFLCPYAQDGTPLLPGKPLVERIMASLATRQPVIEWCLANNVYVMLCFSTFLMWPVERNWPEYDDGRWLWTSASAQQELLDMWRALAARFVGVPGILFELFDEPQSHDPVSARVDDPMPAGILNTLYPSVIAAIRDVDPQRTIILAPEWSAVANLPALSFVGDANIYYAIHPYMPGQFTQQGADGATPAGSVSYPSFADGWNKAWLRTQLQPARNYQLAHGARIVVSEFGAARGAPPASRLAWTTDMYSLFEEWGWDSVIFRYEAEMWPSCFRQSWAFENSEIESLCRQLFGKNLVASA
jgi:hypothetical protein